MVAKVLCAIAICILSLVISSEANADEAYPLKVGAASSEMLAEDSMVIGGSIGPGYVQGQEGRLQATATVIHGNVKLCLVAVDILMMNRDYLDQAAKRIEAECSIPFDHILINASHTHHAPSTVTVHGYHRDELFCQRTVDAIVDAAKKADEIAKQSDGSQPIFRLGQEATVGQNSRQLLKDGRIYWIGPRDEFVRPTDPFDVDLPVLAFRLPSGKLSGVLFNHSTHCIGSRTGKRSPSFYGLAAQDLTESLGTPVSFFSGAAGSTHNLQLDCNEMVLRIKNATQDALEKAEPLKSVSLAATKKEFEYKIRRFDEDNEEKMVAEYCKKYAPAQADFYAKVFRDSRQTLKDQQGESRRGWLQVVKIGEVYLVAVPAEYFTVLGLEIKRRSPHRYTFVCGLSNDYVGYLPDQKGFKNGGYQTWTGLHSFAEIGTGEAIVEETLEMLREVK